MQPESDLLIHLLYSKVHWQDLPCIEFQSVMQNVRNYSTGQTFGWPVLPLVYITTAIPFFVGKLGGTGLFFPSFSTSEKDETFQ
jgi:hypothetical protein